MKTNALFVLSAVVLTSGCASSLVALTPQPKQLQSESCAGYPAAHGSAGSIDDVSTEPSDFGAVCRARAALAAGQFVVSYTNDVLLGEVDGDTTESDDFQDGDLPPVPVGGATPEPAPIGAAADTEEPLHAYGLYVDPKTSVPFTLSADAYTTAEARSEVASWVTATLTPQEESIARSPARFLPTDVTAASYSVSAWTLVASGTIDHYYSKSVSKLPAPMTADYGDAGAIVDVYRLNASADDDYFLVDSYYTQTPRWHGVQYNFPSFYHYWWNSATTLTVKASDPWHAKIVPALVDLAPKTKITSAEVTNTVGKSLSSKYANYSTYSRTESQPSVTTNVYGTFNQPTVEWSDKYEDVGGPGIALNHNPPGTTISTFAGDRLAVFAVPRSVNDDVPVGKTPGLNIDVDLYSEVHGFVEFATIGQVYRGTFKSATRVFAPEPVFAASPASIDVSISRNSATNPAIVNVTAERPDTAQKIRWYVEELPAFLGTNVGKNGITGSAQLKIYPNGAAIPSSGSQSSIIKLDSEPAGASDSLRLKPYEIAVEIVP